MISAKRLIFISLITITAYAIVFGIFFWFSQRQVLVEIVIDTKDVGDDLSDSWGYFGYDEANFTYTPRGRELIDKLDKLSPNTIFFRTHHLLTSGDGTSALKWGSTNAYTKNDNGDVAYNWEIIDRIFDTYLEHDAKPLVEIGFMPEVLSSSQNNSYPKDIDPKSIIPVNAGQSYPPKDYEEWEELVYQWVLHSIERYGEEEVASWNFEVWNEPNILYWQGTKEEYFKLYDYTVEGVKRALPQAKIGGPAIAGGKGGSFLKDFLDHCAYGLNYANGEIGTSLDFISFHAKGLPKMIDDSVVMGISNQLQEIDAAFKEISKHPKFKDKPVIISESDPDGCAACRSTYISYRNTSVYASYVIESYYRTQELAKKYNINLQGTLTWAFEFEDRPYFAGFRALSTNGINLPVLNSFKMMGMMSGKKLGVYSSGEIPLIDILLFGTDNLSSINSVASLDEEKETIYVLVWNYSDSTDSEGAKDNLVKLTLNNISEDREFNIYQYQIDDNNSNAFTAWNNIGSPEILTEDQYFELQEKGELQLIEQGTKKADRGQMIFEFNIPRHGLRLFVIE